MNAGIVLVTLGVACVSVWASELWGKLRGLVTWFHEAGHAVVALGTGGGVRAIKLHADTSGVTEHYSRGVASWLVGLAGYPAPAVVGSALIWGAVRGYTTMVVGVIVVCAVVLLLVQRSWRGIVWTFTIVAVSVGVWKFFPTALEPLSFLGGFFLIAGSFRTVMEMRAGRKTYDSSLTGEPYASDATMLPRIMPVAWWEGVFGLMVLGIAGWTLGFVGAWFAVVPPTPPAM